jgi:hypothetical protein
MSLKIYYRYADGPETCFSFDGDTLTIGRSSMSGQSVDLNLHPDGAVSRRHAILYFDRNRWWVRDTDSKHGVLYQGERITTSTPLRSGDVLMLGDTRLRLQYGDSAEDVSGTQPGVIKEAQTLNPFFHIPQISESLRIDMLSRVARISQQYRGQAALDTLALSIRDLFGVKADHVGVALYEDKQPIPVAFLPPEKSYVSFSLIERVKRDMQAFIWEQANTSMQLPDSMKQVVTAMYAPIIRNRQIIGVLHVDSTAADARFTLRDLEVFNEIAQSSSLLLHEQHDVLDSLPAIFISYSRRDQQFIKQLAGDLRRQVVSVWYDDRLRPGMAWREQLAQAIRVMNVFVLVMSPTSLASKNVAWEIQTAQQLNKVILPVLYKPCENIPEWLRQIQYVDFTQDTQRGLSDLIDEIRRITGR